MLKKALVTGSAGGIGRAIALELAQQGFDVAFHFHHSAAAALQACQAARNLGVQAIALQADVTQPTQAQSLVERTVDQLGGLSVVVNNVGNYLHKSIDQVSFEEWHHILDSNLNSTFYVTQTAIPYLQKACWGRIINLGFVSVHHLLADDLQTPYRIAKAGILIYTKSIAKVLIKHNITANMISPGAAENSLGLEGLLPKLPTQQPATLADIVRAAAFFISPESAYITGQNLEVAGGWRL